MDVFGAGNRRWLGVEGANNFRARLRGLMGRTPTLLILETRTVHSFWLRNPIRLVGIDPSGAVIQVRVLPPGRVAWMRGVRWILEMPTEMDHPRMGERLTLRTIDGEPDLYARSPLSVRHSHRQPR